MHPGNILVTKDGRVAFIDCGICIKLSPKLHDHMIAILGAWMDYDGYGAGELMVDRSNDQSTLGQAVGVDAFCTGMGRLVERAMTEEFFRHFGEYVNVKGARLPLLLLLALVLLLRSLPAATAATTATTTTTFLSFPWPDNRDYYH